MKRNRDVNVLGIQQCCGVIRNNTPPSISKIGVREECGII